MPMERELQELGTQDTSKDAPIGGGRARRPAAPRLSSWPFLLIDGTILFTAAAILNTAERPLPLINRRSDHSLGGDRRRGSPLPLLARLPQ